ncbi:DUF2505 domain-containing protein [uncultured Photobacterium sp.]|uniref:DUF2505 domain-containing protein n=1 Tax=uncultured Photobacterium sp. TaxID=173973 RepID=UPI002634FA4C|nr:DUF2505 domain-containing protein [uncultured Photobacterium sp.]
MQITAIHDYKEKLDIILRFFSEDDLIVEKYQKLGARNVRVNNINETDDGFIVETQREVPANVPAMLKSLLGSYNTIKQKETWHWQENEQLLCHMKVEIIGVPATISGQMMFSEPAESGIQTQNNVSVTVKSSVPLIGSTLVSFICDDIKNQMQAEYDFLREKLPQLNAE